MASVGNIYTRGDGKDGRCPSHPGLEEVSLNSRFAPLVGCIVLSLLKRSRERVHLKFKY